MSQSSLFQQPENLTKERLKSELKKHGVPFEQNENKDYYVRLYRSKVSKSAAGRRQRGEFSSDEELVRRSPRFGTKKQPSKTASQSSYMASVSQLSDEDLAEELRRHGEEPGPIMDSTRGVYQRKLAKLMAEKTRVASKSREEETIDYGTDQLEEWSSHSSEGDTEQEEEEEEEEAEEPPPMRLRSQTTTKSQHMAYVSYSTPTRHVESSYLLRKPKGTPSKGETGGGKSSRVKAPQEAKPRPQSSRPPTTTEGTSPVPTSSIWSSILGFALLVVTFAVVFLAYEHYTSANSFVSQGLSYLKQFGILKE